MSAAVGVMITFATLVAKVCRFILICIPPGSEVGSPGFMLSLHSARAMSRFPLMMSVGHTVFEILHNGYLIVYSIQKALYARG